MVLWEATSRDDFARFLRLAQPGTTALYHVGFLAMDKANWFKPGKAHLPELSREVWENRDAVALTQRKLGPFQYEYRATLRRSREFLQRADHVTGVRSGGGGTGALAGVPIFPVASGQRAAGERGDGEGGKPPTGA
jgi:hypothetical protein